jgi:hypothetical protein
MLCIAVRLGEPRSSVRVRVMVLVGGTAEGSRFQLTSVAS